jgi:hypothetical protein
MYKTILGGVAAMVLLAADASRSQAAEYGSFIMRNPTRMTIRYQVKWGDGPWKSYAVEPGERRYHAFNLDQDNSIPTPRVRFDYVCGDDAVTYKVYRMDCYDCDNPWNGKSYYFRYSPGGVYLFLYDD